MSLSNRGPFMKQYNFKYVTILTIFSAMVLTGIYLNLKILLNQTFFQIFEGDLGLNFNIFVLFIIILIVLAIMQYVISQENSKAQENGDMMDYS